MTHFLKRLELAGFKSFAGKTILEFPSGITAIVGPNGSGKSNVIDAIRWLLGEREARNLRGGTVEDLVFAGTPKRPRMGQAKASIVFENTGNFFPVDYEEVSVTRQVTRGGTGKYFINKSEVRLKDLIDFFAQARLGSRGFTVVTQGKSDVFVEATPRERREMVEEVLGLKEYQLKREEAERRLTAARANLDKVKALVEEILPHLRSLKRQTGRWEKREVVETELRELENTFFGSRWRTVGAELEEKEKELHEYDLLKTALLQAEKSAEERLGEVEAKRPGEQKRLKEIKEETEKLLEKRNEVQKELGRLEARKELGKVSGGTVPGEDFLSVLRNVRRELERALQSDPAGLQNAVRSALRMIAAAVDEKEETSGGESISPELAQAFSKIENDLREMETGLERLRGEEEALGETQEGFYALFKKAVGERQEARDALEKWERRRQEKKLSEERLLMRKEELERQIVQSGREPREFLDSTGSPQARSPQDVIEEGEAARMEQRMFRLRGELAAIGEIDEGVMKEARETEERYGFLSRESEDLLKAEEDLRKLIAELTEKVHTEFDASLHKINAEFERFFDVMFGGGKAKLVLVEEKPKAVEAVEGDPSTGSGQGDEETLGAGLFAEAPQPGGAQSGLEVKFSLPRKKLSSLDALSGGERSLLGIAALFALVSVSPPPFLVLDEIDAALDDRNARRFAELLKEFSKKTQFVVVTHNRATMEAAEVLYGVTLDEDGTSKVLSMKLGAEA